MDFLTPAQIAAELKVSTATVRRMAAAYETVFESLPKDGRGHREWPVEALRRVQVAHQALSTGRVGSMEAALQLVRDGAELPQRVTLPVEVDALAELLAEVRAMRALTEAQGRELAELRQMVGAGRALPVPGAAVTSAEVVERLEAIQKQMTAQAEREAERWKPRAGGLLGVVLRLLGLQK